jgi:3-oxoacyl-[acyl-carrier protein] reductase
MDFGLQGRTAIVSGASSGLGLAAAEALSNEGANVTMVARRREELEQESNRLGALAVRGDVTNARDLERVVERTLEAFGGIDVLVWNSGGPPPGTASSVTDEELEAAFELLLAAAVRLVRLCLPHLRESDGGRIVLITSGAVKEPAPHLALSNALRPGLTGWAKSLSRELGVDGITVNCVAPGRIDTARMAEIYGTDGPPPDEIAQVPLGRLGTPRELGDVVCFLASDRASYISGVTVPVDGGASRSLL